MAMPIPLDWFIPIKIRILKISLTKKSGFEISGLEISILRAWAWPKLTMYITVPACGHVNCESVSYCKCTDVIGNCFHVVVTPASPPFICMCTYFHLICVCACDFVSVFVRVRVCRFPYGSVPMRRRWTTPSNRMGPWNLSAELHVKGFASGIALGRHRNSNVDMGQDWGPQAHK